MNDKLLVEMILNIWTKYSTQTNDLINQLTDEQLMSEIAPGRNRGIYILGHLIAIHDKMFPLLGLGPEMHHELFDIYVKASDNKTETDRSIRDLKEKWSEQNKTLNNYFEKATAKEWFQRHTSVSSEDFEKDKKRNRLNVLLTRIPHLAYHLGQLKLLKNENAQS
jgi:hypothetical protein